ncbi:rhotekin-like isoform 2-T2 [Synchiropus picturatus]
MNNTQDEEVLQQVEREVRMREGASKLLAACSQQDQALEASKTLLACNTRILALLTQLQRMRKAQILQRAGRRPSEEAPPCVGTVAVSDLRIPLMWKDSEYFKNKGELHRCAVFCLLQCGTTIHDTELVLVDRTLTDICFEDPVLFNNVTPDFQLRVEVYSSCVEDDFSPVPVGPKKASRLGGSLGCSSGKKIRAAFESAAVCGSVSGGRDGRSASVSPPLLPDLFARGPKYHLLAHVTLRLHHVHNGFKTHDFSLTASEESPFWLPLYGSMCCRLVAQPLCLTQTALSGPLRMEEEGVWRNIFGVLRGKSLGCYQSQEDLQAERSPVVKISITKETTVSASESDLCLTVHLPTGEVTHVLAASDLPRWILALRHHIFSLAEWKQCAEDLMKMEPAKSCSSRKSLTVKPRSLFHEIVSPCCPTEGAAPTDLSLEIRARLWHYYKERRDSHKWVKRGCHLVTSLEVPNTGALCTVAVEVVAISGNSGGFVNSF